MNGGFELFLLVILGILAGVFWLGGWNNEDEMYKACLDKKEVVVNNVRFKCIPDVIIIKGKEVPYQ